MSVPRSAGFQSDLVPWGDVWERSVSPHSLITASKLRTTNNLYHLFFLSFFEVFIKNRRKVEIFLFPRLVR